MGRAPYLGRFGWEKRKDLDIAREAMALTDVAELENRPFAELSQGEKQRVSHGPGFGPGAQGDPSRRAHFPFRHQPPGGDP